MTLSHGSALAPRTARAIAVAVLAAFTCVYLLAAISGPGDAAVVVPLSLAVLALHLPHVLPGLRRCRGRWLAPVQAVPACVAVLGFGVTVGMLGLVVGALLLRSAWRMAALATAAAAVVAAGRAGTAAGALDMTITVGLTGLVSYGLCRLADRFEEAHAARRSLAMAAVEEERLRMAAALNDGVGRGLDTIAAARPDDLDATLETTRRALATARAAASELRSLSLAPEMAAARGMLAAAGIAATVRTGHAEPLGQAGTLLAAVLREAVTDVVRQGTATRCEIETTGRDDRVVLRVTSDGVRTAARGAEALTPLAGRVAAAGGDLAMALEDDGRFTVTASVRATPPPKPRPSGEYRLSLLVLAMVLAGFSVKALLLMPPAHALAAVPLLVASCALTLRRSREHRGWALAALALLAYVPLLWFGKAWGGTPGFLTGALLVWLPAAVAWPLVVAIMASMGVLAQAFGQGTPVVVNSVVSVLVSGLVVSGLVRLARLADELRAAETGLARAAVVQERLRTARDLHDLLGHTLAAILLKGELARRLRAVAPERADAELADIVAMAEQARADMETVTGAAPNLDLAKELESARSVLAAAGIEVQVTRDDDVLPEHEAVLSTVLREAVTNVLRHSAAERVEIEVARDGLTVRNDGVPAQVKPPGAGIGNLSTRLAALGGRLEARPLGGGSFQLTARLDAADGPDPAARQVGSEPARL
ncbi:sensor histidine kinase [Actinomadura hibisca]|uniref:sensor histidine kinase n=1 Tax=Actinomadura hibisca TaxID=68565 RepID=UPI0008313B8C|nr:histidine kinase [Actinomadura hibisca]